MPHCGTSGKAIFFLYYKNRVFAVRKEAPCIPLDVSERVQGNLHLSYHCDGGKSGFVEGEGNKKGPGR